MSSPKTDQAQIQAWNALQRLIPERMTVEEIRAVTEFATKVELTLVAGPEFDTPKQARIREFLNEMVDALDRATGGANA